MSSPTGKKSSKSDEYPLPEDWYKAYSDEHKKYFFIHKPTRTTSWVDPRDKLWKKRSWDECAPHSDEVPLGWEIAHDDLCGTYFIDHINQTTLLDDPRTDKAKKQVEEMKQFVKSGAIEAILENFTKKMEELKAIEENIGKMDAGERKESELLNAKRLRHETEELKSDMETLKHDIEAMKQLAAKLEETESSQLERQRDVQREIEAVKAELDREVAAKQELQMEIQRIQQSFNIAIPEDLEQELDPCQPIRPLSPITTSPTSALDTLDSDIQGLLTDANDDFVYPQASQPVTRIEREMTLLALKKKLQNERDLVHELIDVKKVAEQVIEDPSHHKPEWIKQVNQYASKSKTLRAKIKGKAQHQVDELTFREKMLFYTAHQIQADTEQAKQAKVILKRKKVVA
ncbi:hypothetical protein SeMB42_g03777 [Synchytrium endobioticum]|uniref:WW domain-containing protein n=1 Tax=Synchytrium endobioticum TaxID=286115 RepID=A0A507D479_9FUNG|nr:hypothetical protein SeLEV6574_g03624 [Synchytrium endobioticum]TPX46272.1 hypothetical protein SeMB42_g03777 [Synchytrium endobioticum]